MNNYYWHIIIVGTPISIFWNLYNSDASIQWTVRDVARKYAQTAEESEETTKLNREQMNVNTLEQLIDGKAEFRKTLKGVK